MNASLHSLLGNLLTGRSPAVISRFVPALLLGLCGIAGAADPPAPANPAPAAPSTAETSVSVPADLVSAATESSASSSLKISDSYPISELDETTVTSTLAGRRVVNRPDFTPVSQLDEVILTASPNERPAFEQPRAMYVLDGDRLEEQLQPTLGETLSNVPGVRSTYFGPAASRPVIRGLDGDRIRILQNGVNTVDASATSFDHAVSINTMSAERIEIVRGPATLLYGANAIGGVVNILDNRIPEQRIDDPLRGSMGARYSSVDEGLSRDFLFEGGRSGFNYHVELSRRESENLQIPGFARSERLRALSPLDPGETEAFGELPNSYGNTEGVSLGTSYVWDDGFFGLAYSGFETQYGSPAEESVSIDMEQRRWDFRGAFTDPIQGIKEIEYKFGFSDYEHTEFEGSEVGTTFKNRGYDGRIEVRHEKVGMLEGTIGYQTERSDFSALGEEAFLPPVLTLSNSAFLFEEADLAPEWKLQGGARYDHITADAEATPGFGPARSRVFDNTSGSLGLVYLPNDDYAVTVSPSWSERAPTYLELYANGPHVATGVFEIGDSSLPVEQALGFELSLRKRTGFVTGSITPYYSRFNNYVGLFPTGASVPFADGEVLPVTVYRNTDAEFYGGEIETTFHLLGPVVNPEPVIAGSKNPVRTAKGVVEVDEFLDLELKADYVNATDTISGDPLPRISPFHASAALDYRRGNLGSRLEGIFSSDQDRTANNELPTDSYFMINASVSYTFHTVGYSSTKVYVKGVNLTDEEAREHTSFLKDIAPLAGRGVAVGVKVEY